MIDARGGYVLPGFIQTHIHLCQTLFRGYADDLPLMDWLRTRVWPMEAAHTPDTLRAAARLATTELLCERHDRGADDGDGARHRCGVRSGRRERPARDDRQVHDGRRRRGAGAAAGSRRARSIDESLAIRKRWHGAADGRLRAAFAPRFAVSCSRELLEAVARPVRASTTRWCTRTPRNRATRSRSCSESSGGLTNIEYLASLQLASPQLCAAHCVWVDEREQQLLADHDVKVMHCPGSNLKLGSGIAPVPEMRARGITVSLGADGAACNNRLDMFEEMRLAAVLQAMRQAAGRAAGARRAVDGDARRRADAGARSTRSGRSKPARRPTSSSSIATGRISRPGPTRTRRSSTPRAAATSGRRSSTACCWSTNSRRSGSIGRGRESRRGPRRARWRPAPACNLSLWHQSCC